MKAFVLVLAAVAAAALWWPRPAVFDVRWVNLPPAMSWDTITKARMASGRPLWMPFCNVEKDCRFS